MRKIFLGIGALVVVVGIVVWLGWFPVAKSSAGIVWYRDLSTFESATKHFQDVARQKDPSFGAAEGSDSEKRRIYLQELIVRSIVKKNLGELDKNSFQGEIDTMVNKAKEGKDISKLEEATVQLYGLSFARYQALVLQPQAEELVLSQHVESSGKAYGEWLKDKAKNTAVTIYFLPYKWQDGALVNK